MSLDSSDTRF